VTVPGGPLAAKVAGTRHCHFNNSTDAGHRSSEAQRVTLFVAIPWLPLGRRSTLATSTQVKLATQSQEQGSLRLILVLVFRGANQYLTAFGG